MIDLSDFGAAPGGNCDAAFSSFMDEVIGQQKVGYIPSGEYILSSGILRNVAGQRFAIRGASKSTTRIICDNAPHGLVFNSSSRSGSFEVSDLTIISRGDCGTGIGYSAPEGGAQHHRSATCHNVLVEGENDTTDNFETCFDFSGTWHTRIENCEASGPWVGVDNGDSSQRFAGKVGFKLDGAYSPWLNHVYAWGQERNVSSRSWESSIVSVSPCGIGSRITCLDEHPISTGFKVRVNAGAYTGTHVATNSGGKTFDIPVPFVGSEVGTAYPEVGPEAFWISNFVLNGAKRGIDLRRPQGREPIFNARDGHINFRDFGLSIDGAKMVNISGVRFYNEDTANYGPGNARDISLRNASDFMISGNSFWFDGAPDRINIFVESDALGKGHNGDISHNTFASDCYCAAWLSSQSRRVRVKDNDIRGTYSHSAVNDVSGLNDVQI